MIQNILVLAKPEFAEGDPLFGSTFRAMGEFVSELSQLYTILKERSVELILIGGEFQGINPGIIRRIRMRAPVVDIWKIVPTMQHQIGDEGLSLDGFISLADGADSIAKKVRSILYQKALLRKYDLVGRSEKMKMIAETIDRIAATDISVLIIGPSGSGKELVARAIHNNSTRNERRFVAVNCGALAEGILESELFGHEKGAFTGSVGKREGLFVQADGGTIFLDEIGETRPDMQVKLLRVLEDGIFYPVGGDKPAHSDVRVIAATNRDLSEAIREGAFREDLYFRLGVVKVILPSLYERKEDILPLLCHFASCEKVKGFSDGAVDLLLRYDWPGNVRQLRNFVAHVAALHPEGEISVHNVEQFIAEQGITQRQLPVVTGRTPDEVGHELIYRALLSLGSEIKMLRDLITANIPTRTEFENGAAGQQTTAAESGGTMQEVEKEMIEAALNEANGNRKIVARKLGIGERTLYRKLKKYHLS
jgi:two-component system NtrC family response regulator